ncbi:CDP-diacylglycerol--serine O-phosphatidyltransferase [hydrothermal vent metagenome]|uniref:CDP-diacylglycerol--serine O-phosphatidyltransferase n=1 Tax=hydrothermal vent metagenome TaxID=652676 RepID=A0A3B1BV03_9ZZZZ
MMEEARKDERLRVAPPPENKPVVPASERKPLIKNPNLRRGIFIVPSLITSAAFFCGFYTIVASINGHFYTAAWAIILAMFFDGIDGRVARATGSTTNFGLQFDSLSDLIAFGAAPAILMYNWVLQPFGRLGWMAAFLFALCGALRLARFNVQGDETPKDRFMGLPIPPAAGLLATTVLLTRGALEVDKAPAVVIMVTIYILALLMVSSIPYHNFKHLDLSRRKPFHIFLGVVLIVFIVAQFPHYLLFAMAAVYALHGPAQWLWANKDADWAEKARSAFSRSKP